MFSPLNTNKPSSTNKYATTLSGLERFCLCKFVASKFFFNLLAGGSIEELTHGRANILWFRWPKKDYRLTVNLDTWELYTVNPEEL